MNKILYNFPENRINNAFKLTEQNPMEYKPEWGHYCPSPHSLDNIQFWLDNPSVCWRPKYLNMKKYSVEQVQVITEWLVDNTQYIWEGPIGYMGFWKFRFTDEIDIMAFKLYV